MTQIVKGASSGQHERRIRPFDPGRDADAVAAVDTSFVATTVLDVVATAPLGFTLLERPILTPRRKRYPLDPAELAGADHVVVADQGTRLVGVAALSMRAWNGRAELSHLYVDAGARGAGVGRALLEAVRDHARALGARCLWVETQNVNAPAIGFYRRHGFACCGLDTTLYDPRQLPGETAVFLALALHP